MTPIVYIDMLFLLNLLMNTITIYSASLIIRRSISGLRLFMTSTLLSLYSCMMFFPHMKLFYTILGKLLILIFATVVAFPSRGIRQILKNTLVFFTVSALFAGIILATIFFTNFGTTVGAAVSNGEVYLDINASTLVFSVVVAYVAIYTISYIKCRSINVNPIIYNAEIALFGKIINIPIFADTGCLLKDPIRDRPAIILSKKATEELIPKEILNNLNDTPDINQLGKYGPRYCILPFSTIDKKSSILHGFVPDRVLINDKEISSCVIALSDKPLSTDSQFEGIFNPMLLKVQDEVIINNI